MRQRRVLRALAIPLVFAFVAASCGSDDDGGSGSDETTAPDATDGGGDDDGDVGEGDVAEGDVDTTLVEVDASEAVYGGELIMGLEAEAGGLRPWEDNCASPCVNIMHTLYDVLIEQTADGDFDGYLAEGIESNEDFTVWTMTLRPDITFSNGTPVTAQTIADMFPIQAAGTTASAQVQSSGLTSVEATGDLEVAYTLAAPNSAFPSFLTGVTLGMVFDPALAASDPDGYAANPIGTGPFTLQSRDLDNETVVVRRDDYWRTNANGDQLPYLDSISFRPISDEGSRLDSLLSGTVNGMQSLRQGTIRDARASSDGLTLIEFQGNNVGGGMYNTALAPYDDVRVRMGLNMLNDQERVIEALGGTGISLPGTQWFSPDSPFWSEETASTYPDFDFDAGTALITEYVNDPARSDGKAVGEPIDVELSCPPDPTLIAAMQVLEQVWAGSNLVNVSLTQFDQPTHINNAINDEHAAHCWRHGGESDPQGLIAPFVAPAELSVANWANFDSPTMQEAVAAAGMTDDFEERKALYAQVMQEINNLALLWYSGHTANMIAVEDNVQGINSWTLPNGALGVGIPDAVGIYTEVFISE